MADVVHMCKYKVFLCFCHKVNFCIMVGLTWWAIEHRAKERVVIEKKGKKAMVIGRK